MDNQNLQRTLAIIKPDAFAQKLSGKIVDRIEQEGLSIIGIKVLHVSAQEAAQFYAVHTGKPFFDELVDFLSSGKIMVLALEGIEAIALWRKIMGATDPAKADEGTHPGPPDLRTPPPEEKASGSARFRTQSRARPSANPRSFGSGDGLQP